MIDVTLGLETGGVVNLSERGPKKTEYSGFDSIQIISDKTIDDMGLTLSLSDQGDAEEENIKGMLQIRLACYHVPTEGQERHFHSALEIFLRRKEVEELRGFIAFLLDHSCMDE
jgi:hypothetical protein